jgi:hypothetical protein
MDIRVIEWEYVHLTHTVIIVSKSKETYSILKQKEYLKICKLSQLVIQ